MSSGDMLVVALSVVYSFIFSHICVDKEFPEGMRNGALAVMGVSALLYVIFGVLV